MTYKCCQLGCDKDATILADSVVPKVWCSDHYPLDCQKYPLTERGIDELKAYLKRTFEYTQNALIECETILHNIRKK